VFAVRTRHAIRKIFDEIRQTAIRYRSQYIESHIQSDALLDGFLLQPTNVPYNRNKADFHVLLEEVRAAEMLSATVAALASGANANAVPGSRISRYNRCVARNRIHRHERER